MAPHKRGEIRLPWRLAATTLMVGSALGLYFIISISQAAPATTVTMPSWVPFWPAFALPYLGMLAVPWLLPLAIRDAARFRACLRSMIYAFLLIVPWWILIPTKLERPPVAEGWWIEPYCWIAMIDPPHCVMPCAHGIGALVAAWYLNLERPTWRWPLVGMLAFGLPSIAFIGQHRPIDILMGAVAAAIGIALGEAVTRRL